MIGYEYEFLVRQGTKPLTRKVFEDFHAELQSRGWKLVKDPGTNGLVGSQKDGFFVTTDDGVCVMEINAPPRDTINEAHEAMKRLLVELQTIYQTLGCSIIGTSVFPGPFHEPEKKLCNKSYIKYYNPQRFKKHWPDLLAIASNHIWLDVAPHELMAQWQFYNRLTPILVALFGSGPVCNEQKLDRLDGRDKLWRNMLGTSEVKNDEQYFGMPDIEFKTLCEYFNFMLSIPFYYTLRGGRGVSLIDKRITYKDFFEQESSEATFFDGEPVILQPLPEDFFRIQQITFPYARIKYRLDGSTTVSEIMNALQNNDDTALLDLCTKVFIECRGVGAQAQSEISAAPAFVLGLQNSPAAHRLLRELSYLHVQELYERALVEGLRNSEIKELTKLLFAEARKVLEERNHEEGVFLAPLAERIEREQNPADRIVERWDQGGLDAVYKDIDFSSSIS